MKENFSSCNLLISCIQVSVTDGLIVLIDSNTQAMLQCDHDKTDLRIIVHMDDGKNGLRTYLVHTIGTDVIIILILRNYKYMHLDSILVLRKFLAFGRSTFQSG